MHNYKTFNDFGKALTELRANIPFIEDYIGEKSELLTCPHTEQQVVAILMDKIKENFPTVLNPEYPATLAITINATEVGFKTKGFYSFGWKTELYNDGTIHYKFRVTFMGNHPNNALRLKIESDLKKLNWRQVEENKSRGDVEKAAANGQSKKMSVHKNACDEKPAEFEVIDGQTVYTSDIVGRSGRVADFTKQNVISNKIVSNPDFRVNQ